jgi:hypothetical protein
MSERKLYAVYIDGTSYVVADSEVEAVEEIERQVNDDTATWLITAKEVGLDDYVDPAWLNCIPWRRNDDGDTTVDGWRKRMAIAAESEAR